VTDIVTVTVTVDPFPTSSAQPSAGGVFIQDVSEQPAAAPTSKPNGQAPKPEYGAVPPASKPEATQQAAPKATQQAPAAAPAAAAPQTVVTTVVTEVAKPSPSPSPKASPAVAQAPAAAPAAAPASSPAAAPASSPAAAPASSPAASSGGSDYQSAIVNEHNIHRANHSSPALEWDDTLAGFAQITAAGCVFAHDM
jgi:uncharacterized protein YkwD